MIRRLGVFLLTIVAMVLGVNFVCQAQTRPLLTRHVREVTLNGQAQSVGRLPRNPVHAPCAGSAAPQPGSVR